MIQAIPFHLDGAPASALPGETILDCALRLGKAIPHECCHPGTDSPRNGRCRTCLVEVEGERLPKASCREKPTEGARVWTDSALLRSLRVTLAQLNAEDSGGKATDRSHPAITVDHGACILCGLCVHACRDIQGQDVLGLAGRGKDMRVIFDLDKAMGQSSCVACGQCVEVCPTGALRSRAYGADAAAAAPAEATVTRSVCPFCCVGCRLDVHVRAARIVDVKAATGPTDLGRLCVKGRFGQDFIHHGDRLTTPMIRLPDVPKNAALADWHQAFRPAGWDEALDFAAAGLQRQVTAGGADAVAFFGSLKTCNEDGYLLQKLARLGFRTNNIDHPTRLCHASSTAALLESVGAGAPTTQIAECSRADVIFVIGANPSDSHPVAGSIVRNAVRAGAKLIVADPRGQALDRFADHVLRFAPGTDVVLLNAMIGIIIEENLINHAFIEARVDGLEDIARRSRDFPPALAAEICGVDEETLRAVARTYARAGAAMTIWGMGMTQHSHGTNNVRALVAMALICGHVGRPGTGLYPIRGHNNAQGAPDSGMLPNYLPDYQPVADLAVQAKFAGLWGQDLPTTPGLTMIEIIAAIESGTITGLYSMGANPAMNLPGLNDVHKALAKLDHLVVQDIFPTDTAVFADVILPAAALLEKTGTLTNIDRRVQMTNAALPPPGDARPDWWIVQEMARRRGLDWGYGGPAEIFDEMRRSMPSIAGITWERLQADGAVQYPCRNEGDDGTPFLFAERFNTPSGRAQLVPADGWMPASAASEEFPLIMTTGRILGHHTGPMSRRAPVLDALDPVAFVCLNPVDMENLGLAAEDRVRVRSAAGEIEAIARPDPALPVGLVFSPFCFSEAAPNRLAPRVMDPSSKTGELKYSAVSVTRI